MTPKKRRAVDATLKLQAAERLVDAATDMIASAVPPGHPSADAVRETLLQLRRTVEIMRQTIKRIP